MIQRQPSHVKFWTEYLAGIEPTLLRTRGHRQDHVSHIVSHPLSSIENTSQQELSSSLLPICQIAWAKVLENLFKQSDVCFGNVVSGRSDLPEHLDDLVLPTFNTIPFRIDITQYSSDAHAVKSAQRANAASIAHQFCPLRMIQSGLNFTESGIFSSILLLQSSSIELDPRIWSLEREQGVMDVSDLSTRTAALEHVLNIHSSLSY